MNRVTGHSVQGRVTALTMKRCPVGPSVYSTILIDLVMVALLNSHKNN